MHYATIFENNSPLFMGGFAILRGLGGLTGCCADGGVLRGRRGFVGVGVRQGRGMGERETAGSSLRSE
jgi:hypothetical protein